MRRVESCSTGIGSYLTKPLSQVKVEPSIDSSHLTLSRGPPAIHTANSSSIPSGTAVMNPSRPPCPEIRIVVSTLYFAGAKYPPLVRTVAAGALLMRIATWRQLPSCWMCDEVYPST